MKTAQSKGNPVPSSGTYRGLFFPQKTSDRRFRFCDRVGLIERIEAMNPESNRAARQAIDEAASAIQSLARAFTDNRTPAAIRNDFDRARERLSAAMENVFTAAAFLE
jgi:hypothetical protein